MKVKVTDESVLITEYSCINEGEVGVNICEFDLPECFAGLRVTAVFDNLPVPVNGDFCIVPPLKKGTVTLGVYAYNENAEEIVLMYSPKATVFYVNKGSYSDEIGVENTPTITEFEQYCHNLMSETQQVMTGFEKAENKVSVIDENSTDEQYPTAKAVYQLVGNSVLKRLANGLKTYFTNVQTLLPQLAYATEDNIGNTLIQNAQDIVDVLENDAEEPEIPTDKTLVSISATYTDGNVTVGKDVSSLTGVTVTAIYSDGSTSDITNYTLSGEIAEGENTITVTYEGLTTTFVVIGEEVATDENKINIYNGFVGQDSTSTSEPTTNTTYPNAVGSSVITMPEVEGTSSYTYEIKLNSNITDVTVINWKVYDADGVRVANQNGLNPMSLSDKTRSVRLSLLNQKATADGSDAVITGFTITVKIGSTVKGVFEYGVNDLRG